jgi:FtsP/CotA-like multicopper oxidase with cupredoxin domain
MSILAFVVLAQLFAWAAQDPTTAAPDCSQLPASDAPAALANDNRTPAGSLRGGTLTLRLVLQAGRWYPEGEQGCGIGLHVFGEEGKAAQTPGPLIRVPVGTELRVTVRNAIATPIVLRGLHDRPRAGEAVTIQPGTTHEFAFRASTPGNYFYFAAGREQPFVAADQFAQAVGAFIVDPTGQVPRDRVFVMTRWRGPPNSPARQQNWELTAFNGRSWPHTERISATVGDTVRWRVIAGNNDGHAMHLHGFYYVIESHGNFERDNVSAPADQRTVVTEPFGPGSTMTMRWVPERAGNWIFHCHLVRHMSAAQRVDRMPGATVAKASAEPAHDSHALHEMGGLVLGINVRPARTVRSAPPASATRAFRLFANQRDNIFGAEPGFGFVLQEGERQPARDSVRIPGSPLLVTRGESVRITVMNRLSQPLGVHWHGIELESYFDGVAGWSGEPNRIAPPIAPGDSFVVRFTPPRAGTFIYHIHNEAGEELPAGLYGALLVLEPGARYDPDTDRMFVISEPGPGRTGFGQIPRPPFVNGSAAPQAQELVVGRTNRFRIVAIQANEAYQVALRRAGELEQWRLLAQDGADVSPVVSKVGPARIYGVAAGMTFDYAFTPTQAGEVTLEVDPLGPPAAQPIGKPTKVTLRVRPQ